VTFNSPVAICRYLARAAASAGNGVNLYGADLLQQAEVRPSTQFKECIFYVSCP
jgi:hypothetical protein